ncbi:hypothetical protein [Actinomadura rudentiformis]|uniref:GH26 domain-containing protein n=1 Tax=Actinomadura rudentiformis TaxID=359158 RepID=A0A6H9YP81_9ACTN|nr:hypothetical protein [Actinomadura rudentiformis]KAB2340833.1 hypothetical protein F8566_43755 [Actinomadura rudentiformis]
MARQAAPGRKFGFYGLNGHTQKRYYPLARKLAVYEAAFFPSLYTRHGTDNKAWTKVLKNAIAQARAVDPKKPIYIYMWPRYHKNTPHSMKFIPAKQWTYQLTTAYKLVDGVVIWAQSKDIQVPENGMEWVHATRNFMKTHPHE